MPALEREDRSQVLFNTRSPPALTISAPNSAVDRPARLLLLPRMVEICEFHDEFTGDAVQDGAVVDEVVTIWASDAIVDSRSSMETCPETVGSVLP